MRALTFNIMLTFYTISKRALVLQEVLVSEKLQLFPVFRYIHGVAYTVK